MRISTHSVGAGAPLTSYLQEPSDSLSNAGVRPAVLILPGGGYRHTSDREAEPVALAYLAEGFQAFVLRYAVGPDASFDDALGDARAALAWVRSHAGELWTDPDRVAAVGFSAGGHLAASLGTLGDPRPDALVLGYPVIESDFGPRMEKDIPDAAAAVTADTPATFLFHTVEDAVVPVRHALAFLSALDEHGVPFEAHLYRRGPHGISLARPLTSNGQAALVDATVAQWLPASVAFLHGVFGDFPTA